MNALVVYDSQYGNTERIARAIADTLDTLGRAQAVRVDSSHPAELHGIDTLIVGCPTQGWKPTPAMQAYLESVSAAGHLHGFSVACFDTRFRKSRLLTGSAAAVMVKRLARQGITTLVPPESFFVTATKGPLFDGELERAAVWARMLFNRVETPHPALQR